MGGHGQAAACKRRSEQDLFALQSAGRFPYILKLCRIQTVTASQTRPSVGWIAFSAALRGTASSEFEVAARPKFGLHHLARIWAGALHLHRGLVLALGHLVGQIGDHGV